MFVEEFAVGTIFVVSNSEDVDVGRTTFSNDVWLTGQLLVC